MSHAVAAGGRLSAGTVLSVGVAVGTGWAVLALVQRAENAPGFLATWAAMAVAMMIPTVTRPMRRAAAGSVLRAWLFLGGFTVVWLAMAPIAFAVMHAITWTTSWIFLAWMVAGAYQLTPWMQLRLRDCRSVRFDGRPFDYGVRQGIRCIGSCGPVMIAVMITAMAMPSAAVSLLLLLAATAMVCWEKRPSTRSAAVAGIGVTLVVVGAVGFVTLGGSSGSTHHPMSTSRS